MAPIPVAQLTKEEQIKQILCKNIEDRTSADIIQLSQHIEDVNFLQQFIGTKSPEFLEMCKFLEIETYAANHYLFRQGDKGETMYIVLEGEVKIFINAKSKNGATEQKEVAKLQNGGSFGELALLFNQIRNATIRLEKPSTFIVLRKEIFQKYIKYKTPPNAQEILQFYDQHILAPYALDLPKKIQILSKTEQANYISNALIIKQGHPINSLFFVKKGVVKVNRVIQFRVHPITKQMLQLDESDPTEEEIATDCFQEISLEIDEIYEGSLMADYELYSKIGSTVSFVAYTPCEILSIQREDLIVLPQKISDDFTNGIRPYPADYKLRRIYLEGLDWQKFRNRIVEGVCKENILRKKLSSSANFFSRSKLLQMPQPPQLACFDDSFMVDAPDPEAVLQEVSREEKDYDFLNRNEERVTTKLNNNSSNKPSRRVSNAIILEDTLAAEEEDLGWNSGQKHSTNDESTKKSHSLFNKKAVSPAPQQGGFFFRNIQPRHHFMSNNVKLSQPRKQNNSYNNNTNNSSKNDLGQSQFQQQQQQPQSQQHQQIKLKLNRNSEDLFTQPNVLLESQKPKLSTFEILMKQLSPLQTQLRSPSSSQQKKPRNSTLRQTFSEAVTPALKTLKKAEKKSQKNSSNLNSNTSSRFISMNTKDLGATTFSVQGSHRLLNMPDYLNLQDPTMKTQKKLLPKITQLIQSLTSYEDIICKTNFKKDTSAFKPPSVELL